MRIFLLLTIFFVQTSCSTVELAKEVTKASSSLKTSVQNIVKSQSEDSSNIEIENKIEKEKEILEIEKEEQKDLVKIQKKIVKINFMGKTINEVYMKLGDSNLFRLDGDTQTMRYDAKSCRLFLFFNSTTPIPRVEYFEMRDENGNLIKEKINIEQCYKNFDLG